MAASSPDAEGHARRVDGAARGKRCALRSAVPADDIRRRRVRRASRRFCPRPKWARDRLPAKLDEGGRSRRLHAAMKNVNLSEGQSMQVLRYANRVPLQFQPAACAITQSVIGNNWRAYGLSQSRGQLPTGPVTLMVHMASVWVPFTSESKEAIASYPEIMKELRLGLQAVGRKLGMYLNQRKRVQQEGERREIFLRYLGEVATAVASIKGYGDAPQRSCTAGWWIVAKRKTAVADTRFDDRGKKVEAGEEDFGENVLIVDPEQGVGDHGKERLRRAADTATLHRQGQEDPRLDSRPGRRRGPVRGARPSAARGDSVALALERAIQPIETHHRNGNGHESPRAVQSDPGQELHADAAGRLRVQATDRAGKDDQHPRSFLPAEAHDRRHAAKRHSIRRTNATRSSRTSKCRSMPCAKNCISTRRTPAPWSGRSRSSTAATRSIVHAWGRAATAFRRSSSPRSCSSRRTPPSSSCTSKRTRCGGGSTRTNSGKSTTAS